MSQSRKDRRAQKALSQKTARKASRGDVDALYRTAMQQHQAGQIQQAWDGYQAVLKQQPDHAGAHYYMGIACLQSGRYAQGAELLQASVRHGWPESVDTLNNIGYAMRLAGRYEESMAALQKALKIDPSFIEGLSNMGSTLYAMDKVDAALSFYEECYRKFPFKTVWLSNIGALYDRKGNVAKAKECCTKALSENPNLPEAYNTLGSIARHEKNFTQADAYLQKAVSIKPDFAEAYFNLGVLYHEMRDASRCNGAYYKALQIKPDFAEAHAALGRALEEQGDKASGLKELEIAYRLKPDLTDVWSTLIMEWGSVARWDEVETLCRKVEDRLLRGDASISPFTAVSLPSGTSAELQLKTASLHSKDVERRVMGLRPAPFTYAVPSSGKLRIAYMSSDFHVHAVGYLISGVLEHHDRERFEIIGYSLRPDYEKTTERARIKAACDRFVDVDTMPAGQAAEMINRDGVDVLVDLNGYTSGHRADILALRPAPIQVNYLGYPGTMGADFMDYIIVDPFIVPEGKSGQISEKAVYMPHTYQPNDNRRTIAANAPGRSHWGLPEDRFVFASFNQIYKITRRQFAQWTDILKRVPDSVLWLWEQNAIAPGTLRQAAIRYGVDPARLIFAPRAPQAEHLARLRHADLILDTLPYNAHTTTSDALWAGVPVLTRPGDCFVSRVAGSILRAAGLPELIVGTEAEYIAAATALATTRRAELDGYRKRLADTKLTCPLFDTAGYARHLEKAYGAMVERRRQGLGPDMIRV